MLYFPIVFVLWIGHVRWNRCKYYFVDSFCFELFYSFRICGFLNRTICWQKVFYCLNGICSRLNCNRNLVQCLFLCKTHKHWLWVARWNWMWICLFWLAFSEPNFKFQKLRISFYFFQIMQKIYTFSMLLYNSIWRESGFSHHFLIHRKHFHLDTKLYRICLSRLLDVMYHAECKNCNNWW